MNAQAHTAIVSAIVETKGSAPSLRASLTPRTRAERDFGIGYGRSSGYRSQRYVANSSLSTNFRVH